MAEQDECYPIISPCFQCCFHILHYQAIGNKQHWGQRRSISNGAPPTWNFFPWDWNKRSPVYIIWKDFKCSPYYSIASYRRAILYEAKVGLMKALPRISKRKKYVPVFAGRKRKPGKSVNTNINLWFPFQKIMNCTYVQYSSFTRPLLLANPNLWNSVSPETTLLLKSVSPDWDTYHFSLHIQVTQKWISDSFVFILLQA